MRVIIISLFIAMSCFGWSALDSAEVLYQKGDYNSAISVLRADGDSYNPEVLCRIGWYSHYLSHDSRPFSGDPAGWSDTVITYLDRAIEQNAGWFGDAQYFLGAEYGARALDSLMAGSNTGFVNEYRMGFDKGCYPPWFVEYGRNLLTSCAANGILFVVGDFQYNSTQCCQQLEGFRKDVTVIPMGYMLGRPGFVQRLRDGLDNVLVSVPIEWSDREIMNIRPYKWRVQTLEIQPPQIYYQMFHMKYPLLWELKPDMESGDRELLSPWRAVFAEIVESNSFQRPVYMTYGWPGEFYAGLYPYTMDIGLIRRLLPFTTGGTEWETNWSLIEEVLLNPGNLKDFATLDTMDMPRILSGLRTYHRAVYGLANHYLVEGDSEQGREIIEFMKKYLPTNTLFDTE